MRFDRLPALTLALLLATLPGCVTLETRSPNQVAADHAQEKATLGAQAARDAATLAGQAPDCPAAATAAAHAQACAQAAQTIANYRTAVADAEAAMNEASARRRRAADIIRSYGSDPQGVAYYDFSIGRSITYDEAPLLVEHTRQEDARDACLARASCLRANPPYQSALRGLEPCGSLEGCGGCATEASCGERAGQAGSVIADIEFAMHIQEYRAESERAYERFRDLDQGMTPYQEAARAQGGDAMAALPDGSEGGYGDCAVTHRAEAQRLVDSGCEPAPEPGMDLPHPPGSVTDLYPQEIFGAQGLGIPVPPSAPAGPACCSTIPICGLCTGVCPPECATCNAGC